jgi:hypothetical protein
MKYLALIFLFICCNTNAQNNPDAKRDYVWAFGAGEKPYNLYGSGFLDFNTNPPDTNAFDHDLNMYVTNCSVADTNGELLFFSNGMFVADCTGHVMPHGDSINFGYFYLKLLNNHFGYSIEQGIIALQLPENDSLFYLIHNKIEPTGSAPNYGPNIFYGLYLSIVNMKANNGLGDVIAKNQLIVEDTLGCGRITAVRHGNGRDWWLLAPEHNNNAFYRLLLDSEGIHVLGKLMIGDTNQDPYGYGQAVFSPNGEYYARIKGTNDANSYPIITISLYNFDRCHGILSNYMNLSFTDTIQGSYAVGIAFSPNSRYMYISGFFAVYQYDLYSPDIFSSRQLVAHYDGFQFSLNPSFFGIMQLGPDNRIYSFAGYTPFLHVIMNSDSGGIACNIQQHFLRLPYFFAGLLTIPNNPNFRLGKWEGSFCDTLSSVPAVENGNWLQVKAVPNPASEAIQFELSVMNNYRPLDLEIYNALSQKMDVLRITPFQGIVPYQVNRLVNGLYIALLRQNGKAVGRVKFVVNH